MIKILIYLTINFIKMFLRRDKLIFIKDGFILHKSLQKRSDACLILTDRFSTLRLDKEATFSSGILKIAIFYFPRLSKNLQKLIILDSICICSQTQFRVIVFLDIGYGRKSNQSWSFMPKNMTFFSNRDLYQGCELGINFYCVHVFSQEFI